MFHGGASAPERWLIRMALRLPNLVIAQSGFAGRVIRDAGCNAEIVQVPNWSHAAPDPAPRGQATQPECLFIAGQEARRKGAAELIAAASILHGRGCSVRFRLIAVPPRLAAEIEALALPGITMQGPASHAAVLAAMRECEIFLLPSHGEGFPNSLVEAMAAGMACIATPVGAVPEMAGGGGMLTVPVGDADALADAIERLVQSPRLRAVLGERARQTVSRHYTAAAALPGLAAAYERLASRNRRRVTPGALERQAPGMGRHELVD